LLRPSQIVEVFVSLISVEEKEEEEEESYPVFRCIPLRRAPIPPSPILSYNGDQKDVQM